MSDYTIDWSHTNVDGNNTIHGPDGDIGVKISTPQNAQGKQWFVENGMLKNWDVSTDSSADITFSQEVENVSFTLLDVDRLDEVTIMTKDEDGNPVEVQFEVTGVHDVNGNVVTGTQTNGPGPGDANNGQDINITIPGPVKTFWIVLDDGPERHYSGTVAVSDIHFDVAAIEDGYVDGTDGDDVIDVAYTGDEDGDRIDNSDAILPGEGANDDVVLAGSGKDVVKSGAGDDEIYGGKGDDMIFAGSGNDVIYAEKGDDKVEASDGEDVIFGGLGTDDLWGGLKNDVISGGAGNDDINAGDGDDVASGGKGNDTIEMGNGNDVAYGGVGADTINGGDGNDTLIGGNQSFNGTQTFNDLATGELVDGQYVADGVSITSADPTNPVMVFDSANPTGGDHDLATNNLGKMLILSEDRDGSDPDDNASGGTFVINFENPASVSALTLLDADGGAWVKYYDMDGNLLKQIDVRTADNGQHVVNTDLHNVAKIEVILGSSGAIDNLTYSINPDNMDGNDVISGGDGDDYIEGNAGNDNIDGGADNDEIFGGEGNDRIFGNDGDDVAFGGAGDDNLGGSDRGNDEYYGGAGNDMFETSFGDDTLYGGEGDDNLWASADNDTVFGGTGNDSAFGGQGTDLVYGDEGDDTLAGGSGDDKVYGGDGNDIVEGAGNYKDDTGADGNDMLFGGSGDDIMIANAGDMVDGGAGGTDHDTLDLTGEGPFYLEDVVEDSNGNGIDGTVVFVDADGNPTGETLTFTEIEKILGEEVNRGPDAVDDMAETDEDTPVIIDVLGNDSDPDGDPLEIISAVSPQGTVEINPDGTLTFTPNADFNGMTTVDYVISDGNGGTDKAWVKVTVNSVNDGPDAVDDTDTTDEDTAIVVDLLANDTDADGDTLTVTNVSVPAEQGTIVDNGDGTATFTPAPNFTGTAMISYDITDGNGGRDWAKHFVEVESVNDGPVATDDADTTDQNTAITLDNVLGNDTDVEGDDLTVTKVNGMTGKVGDAVAGDNGGLITINADGTASFDPNGEFDALGNGETATTSVSYMISDGNGGTDMATVTVTVNGVNDAPDAVDGNDMTMEDTAVVVDLLANDTDVDGDTLTITNVSVPAEQGTIVDNGDGTATFTPAPNFTGTAMISYDITDGNGGRDWAKHFVEVKSVNDGPVAIDDADATDQDTSIVLDNVLGNDSDDDGDDLVVTKVDGMTGKVGDAVAASNGGLITINADGSASFDPNGEFDALGNGDTAETSVTYMISDGNGGTSMATVTVTVTGTNDAPEATNSSYVVSQDEEFGDVDANAITDDTGDGVDSDVDGDPLSVAAVNGDAGNVGAPIAGDNGGLFIINADGSVDFSANGEFDDLGDGEEASTTVTYTITDPEGGTDTATVTFTVTGTNDGPVATNDADATDQNTSIVLDNVLGNDTDDDGDDLVVTKVDGMTGKVGDAVAASNGGLITINADGSASFDPNGEFDGLATGETAQTSVTYMISDGNGGTDMATVTVTVTGTNDAPIANIDEDVTDFNTAVTVDLLANDMDVDGDDLTVIAATVPAEQGTLVDNGDGTVTFTPAQNFTGEATISYTIQDEEGLQDSSTHIITVGDAPLDGTVEGTAGDDIINGDYMGDPDGDMVDNDDAILPGDEGDDDLIYGFDGNDSIEAGNGDDEVFGGTGDDIIRGGAGDDTLNGDEGMDMIFGGTGDDTLDGGDGDDKIEGGSGDDTIIGGEGDDDLWGASGDDSVDGGAGNDTIATAEGNDIVEGGDGDDVIDTANDENPFTTDPGQNLPDVGYPGVYPADEDPNDDLDTVFGGAGNDSITTGDDDDSIFGGTGDDTIDSGWDDDLVEGGDGNDTITAGEGNDEVFGGEGNDTIYGGLEPGVADELNLPDDVDLVDFNNNDTLFGGNGNDTIFGADDDDTLFGGDGDDVLNGGVDEDEVFGGFGSDTIVVDEEGHGAGDVVVGGEDPDDSDVDVLDLTGSGVDFITYADDDPEAGVVTFLDGSTLTFSEIENVVPCFTPGTTIATPKGERLVEELREGDRIITRDNGIQEIRWVGRKEMTGKQLVANPHLKPILIKAGSLGNGLPERDMLVSPNHRMLVASEKTQLYFEEREVLASAKHLVGSEGIHAVDVMATSYIHFMFDRHEVVLSNGAWTESFQPGDYSLKGIGNSQRNEIFELFPELQEKQGLEGYQSARRALKKHEARLLVGK